MQEAPRGRVGGPHSDCHYGTDGVGFVRGVLGWLEDLGGILSLVHSKDLKDDFGLVLWPHQNGQSIK